MEPRRAVRIWARTHPHGWTCNKADTRKAVCSSFIASLRLLTKHSDINTR